MDIQAYKTTTKLETFSYLPEMTTEQVKKQIAYMIRQGWNPGVEHTEIDNMMGAYWYMWKLPMFGEQSIDAVMAELESCRRENQEHLIRVVGYDNYAQCQGLAFVVYRGR